MVVATLTLPNTLEPQDQTQRRLQVKKQRAERLLRQRECQTENKAWSPMAKEEKQSPCREWLGGKENEALPISSSNTSPFFRRSQAGGANPAHFLTPPSTPSSTPGSNPASVAHLRDQISHRANYLEIRNTFLEQQNSQLTKELTHARTTVQALRQVVANKEELLESVIEELAETRVRLEALEDALIEEMGQENGAVGEESGVESGVETQKKKISKELGKGREESGECSPDEADTAVENYFLSNSRTFEDISEVEEEDEGEEGEGEGEEEDAGASFEDFEDFEDFDISDSGTYESSEEESSKADMDMFFDIFDLFPTPINNQPTPTPKPAPKGEAEQTTKADIFARSRTRFKLRFIKSRTQHRKMLSVNSEALEVQ
ncbi:uncharacterized protein VTP21DRAFT_2438 [Calcarisporiella thermophila]|uniref:uncharacterized protein n=1 Tax=Calcarisporiella thermophila TaxID=911321 RepID=UPI003743A89B